MVVERKKWMIGRGGKMETTNRRVYLDKLKVVATCALVLMHTAAGVMAVTDLSAYPAEKKILLIVIDLTQWGLPMLAMVSGYLFLGFDKRISVRLMAFKYCIRVILALILFGAPLAVADQIAAEHSFSPGMIWEGIRRVFRMQSWPHLRYLYILLLLYMLSPAMRKFVDVIPRGIVYMFMGVALLRCGISQYLEMTAGVDWMTPLPTGGIYFFYYIYGYFFAYEDGVVERRNNSEPWVGILQSIFAPMGVAAMVVWLIRKRLAGADFQMGYNNPFSAVLAVMLFAWARSWQRRDPGAKKNTGMWKKAALLCFGIYLLHPVFLKICYVGMHRTPLDYDLRYSLPLFAAGTIVLSVVVTALLRRVPFLRDHVL